MSTKEYIVLHHSATLDGTVYKDFDSIKRGHLERGYRDIGYHWVVEMVDGKLVATPGRPERDTGAHCLSRNHEGIGICCVGNFQETAPSEELYTFVADLCRQIMTRHPIQEIGGHRDYYATACPGKNFDVDYIRKLVKEGEVMPEGAQEALINVNGKEFPAYITGGHVYFGQGVSVREFMETINRNLIWDSSNLTLDIK